MKKCVCISVFLAMVIVSSLAGAQRMNPFQRMDRDGDGRISPKEFPGPERGFHMKDTNQDGYLSPPEMRNGPDGRVNQNNASRAYQPTVDPSDLRYVDTHNHIVERGRQGNGTGNAVLDALLTMDSNDIKLNLIMPMPQTVSQKNRLRMEDILPIAQQYPDRFALLGGGGTLNVMIQEAVAAGYVSASQEREFDRTAAELIDQGIVGFGEMTAEHFSMREDHPYVAALPDHPLFLRLVDLAAQYNVPVDLHMEAIPEDIPLPARLQSPPNPSLLKANIPALERLLEHNRKAKIVWAHLGWDNTGRRTVELMIELLRRHSNLYMSVRVASGMQARHVARDTFPLDSDGRLKEDWLLMFQAFPDRFMIGSDEIIHQGNSHPSAGSIDSTVDLLKQLPRELRKKIGYANAYGVYKIKR